VTEGGEKVVLPLSQFVIEKTIGSEQSVLDKIE